MDSSLSSPPNGPAYWMLRRLQACRSLTTASWKAPIASKCEFPALSNRRKRLTRLFSNRCSATTVQYTTLFLLPLGCLLLNLGGLFLARRLHQQAAAQIERLTTGTFNISLDLQQVPTEGELVSNPPPPILEPDRRGSVSISALRKLATKKHAEGEAALELASTQAAEALEMLKAKSDLVTNCLSIGAGSTVILGSAIYIAALVGSNEFVTGSWAS